MKMRDDETVPRRQTKGHNQRQTKETLGDVIDWLGEACSSLDKKARTHLLRSPGRPL